ncbi:MAG: sigma-54-dependent Fis family transcriptional regulator [Deltaproteobacteria bacterium]|nr:sigma-54-dependent Fis family transcriptional regulator [Deltaproteobacteria bacterium]
MATEELGKMVKTMIVDDDLGYLRSLEIYLRRKGLDIVAGNDPADALAKMKEQKFDILVTDIRMPKMDGISLAQAAQQENPDISIVLMTAYGTINEAIQALKMHAFDFLLKPVELEHLYFVLNKIVNEKSILWENLLLKKELRNRGFMGKFVGVSASIHEIYETIHRISKRDTPILIEGESGTGKGLLARIIHDLSLRKNEPFVEVNLGAIVPQLMESELFGHVKGSFTGAIRDSLGIILSAQGGTLFLDEVAEIAPDLQVKLLRVLQERKVRPVGGKYEVPIDIRIITATNRPLQDGVESGDIREDFYYRIRVLPIHIPPLRERKEDIPVLVAHILKRLSKAGKSKITAISPRVMNMLLAHDWPGNVRELENVLERCAATSASGDRIEARDLPAEIVHSKMAEAHSSRLLNLQEVEKDTIKRALEASNNNKKEAARMLGIDKSTLHRKIHRYQLLT